MTTVTVSNQQPKQKIILGSSTDKNITVDNQQPKEKIILGSTDKNITVDNQQPKEKIVLTSQGPKGDDGLQGPTGQDGIFSVSDKLIFELQMAFKVANLTNFKELSYTSGNLTKVSIYTNPTKNIKLFTKNLSYTDGQLTQLSLTRISDSITLTKNLVYNPDGTLLSMDTS